MNSPPLPLGRPSDVLPFVQTGHRRPASLAVHPRKLAVVGCFPPRRCGIATFTADMVTSLRAADPAMAIDVYAMANAAEADLVGRVARAVREDERQSYVAAGIDIERSNYDAVWVQHEFGIFGGASGEMLIDLLRPISAPLIVTLHTVLERPSDDQRKVMDWLAGHASKLVVMSRKSAETLRECYGVNAERIERIEHGVPDRPFGRSEAMKRRFGLEAKRMLLTFGLLSPGKGIEVAISSLRRIVSEFPDTIYVIAGATHPRLVAREGEAYRDSLKQLAADSDVAENILWIEDFLETDELLDLIEAADIYLTPYSSPLQATSGTLSYAVALGKAVISTPYLHATELLADNHGVLTPFGDSEAMAAAIRELLGDPAALAAMQQRAYRRGRSMTWANFGERSIEVIESLRIRAPQARQTEGALATRALERLCDGTGILQHSRFSVPDRDHGYCVDDNARALILANQSRGDFAGRAETFASFIQYSWNPHARRFRNFMRYDRSWAEQAGSEDSCGRTLWAIGATAADGVAEGLKPWARQLWLETAGIVSEFNSPRAIAFAMLGADRLLAAVPGDPLSLRILQTGGLRLQAWLEACSHQDWRWFETVLSYDNCRLPQALLAAGIRLGEQQMVDDALSALDWIIGVQTGCGGRFRPVGSESFGSDRLPGAPFDQQPVDAWATLDAATAAWRHTGDRRWIEVAQSAFDWFVGANDRGVALVNLETGGCFDAVTPHGVNLNQGAESVLAFHLAAHSMAALLNEAGDAESRIARDSKRPQPA